MSRKPAAHRLIVGLAIVALGALAPLPGHAATREFTAVGGAIVEPDGTLQNPHFDPATLQVGAGDTIVWHFGENKNHHQLTIWSTDGQYWETGFAPLGDYSRDFTAGTTVWFRCPVHSSFSEGGGCAGMCGAYTSRASAPGAPVVTQPAQGANLDGRTVIITGTAQPDTYVSIVEIGGSEKSTGHMADATNGSWSGELFLSGGQHTVRVTATDALGRVSPATAVTFTLGDDKAPVITMTTQDPAIFAAQQPQIVEGDATDNTEVGTIVGKLYANGAGHPTGELEATCASLCQAPKVHWKLDFSSMATGYYYVVVLAKDIYGNEATLATHVVKVI